MFFKNHLSSIFFLTPTDGGEDCMRQSLMVINVIKDNALKRTMKP